MTRPAPTDGRHARRNASREKITRAFLEFVREGVNEPGAQSVAERAGVSVRTVFRCFEDMEALYQELSAAVRAEFLPRAVLDLNTADRMERLKRLVANRVAMFGEMEPYRLAAEDYRGRYETFEDDYHFLLAKERERLEIAINPDGALSTELFDALTAVTGFGYWRRLRFDLDLSRAGAARVMEMSACAILDTLDRIQPVEDEGGVR
jgi:AcrR family transcriptional regulator